MAASATVFGTYEILEDILLHLPLIDLLHMWEVNHTFRNIVWDSLRINKALFISYATDKTAEWYKEDEDRYGGWVHPEDWLVPVIILNPFLELLLPNSERIGEPAPGSFYRRRPDKVRYIAGHNLFEGGGLDSRRYCHDFAPWTHPGVRWQKDWLEQVSDEHWSTTMLLTDPPITKALIQDESYCLISEGSKTGPRCQTEDMDFIHSPGLVITHLRDFTPPKSEEERNLYCVGGSSEWLPVPNGYNTTGWEMLRLLETEGEQRKEMLREMASAAFPDTYPYGIYN